MYIFIFEDGTFKKAETYYPTDLEAVDDGILDIIDTKTNTYYLYGEWREIESAKTGTENGESYTQV